MNKEKLKELVREILQEKKKMKNPCWKGYKAYGTKEKDGKTVPNCVPKKKKTNEEQSRLDDCWECQECAMEEGVNEVWEECYRTANWDMVPEGDEHTCEGDEFYECYGDMKYESGLIEEAKYRGRTVKLGKPMKGDVKKFKVYVRNPKTGNVKKVNFGDKNMRIKKSNPKRRKSFRARHHCENPGPRTKARYWSCRKW